MLSLRDKGCVYINLICMASWLRCPVDTLFRWIWEDNPNFCNGFDTSENCLRITTILETTFEEIIDWILISLIEEKKKTPLENIILLANNTICLINFFTLTYCWMHIWIICLFTNLITTQTMGFNICCIFGFFSMQIWVAGRLMINILTRSNV